MKEQKKQRRRQLVNKKAAFLKVQHKKNFHQQFGASKLRLRHRDKLLNRVIYRYVCNEAKNQ